MNKVLLEKYANDFRQRNGIGSYDPIRLKSFLSKLNVITVFRPLSCDFSGMSFFIAYCLALDHDMIPDNRFFFMVIKVQQFNI